MPEYSKVFRWVLCLLGQCFGFAATCKIVWLLNSLNDLNVSYTKLALLSCDNQVAIHIASNLDFHLVHDKVQENIIKTLHVV